MIQIRQETEQDYFETENLIREAFWNHYTQACSDHYLVHIMRDCPAFIPELDLVAVEGEKLVGNVMCLKSYISGDDGNRYEVLSLGPIGVLPGYQKKGIGGMLIAKTKEIAKNWDLEESCFVEILIIIHVRDLWQLRSLIFVMQKICMQMRFTPVSCTKGRFQKQQEFISKMKYTM